MTTQWVFNEIATITERNVKTIREKFNSLSEEQRAWKPTESEWSVNQIFAHLNAYANFYHAAFKRRIELTRFREPKENYVSSPLGRSAWVSMKLGNANNVKRKFNTPKAYNPVFTPALVKGNDIDIFMDYQEDLKHIILKATAVNIRKVKVPIAISKIIRLRLGDALLFVAYHNERHVQQALNVLKMKQFPKK